MDLKPEHTRTKTATIVSWWLKLLIISTIVAIGDGHDSILHRTEACDMDRPGQEQCSARPSCKRYVLYDVQPGEGFNLKRDVYVRIAPVISALNDADEACTWILVLHPWGLLPHWKTRKLYTWNTFFDVTAIKRYIPAMELEEYLDENQEGHHVDAFYQLQHFPLNDPESLNWFENVQTEVACESRLKFAREGNEGPYRGTMWGETWISSNASCMRLKGSTDNLVRFLTESNARSFLLYKAEVILWDSYGGPEWWKARKSLQFANHLTAHADKWISDNLLSTPEVERPPYIAFHLRRKDFVTHRQDAVTLEDASCYLKKMLRTHASIKTVFVATDGSKQELGMFQSLSGVTANSQLLTFLTFDCQASRLSEGECAVIDQIICSRAYIFVGTRESTFTLRIFEEREIGGIHPNLNYHVLCKNCKLEEPLDSCPKATRWPMI